MGIRVDVDTDSLWDIVFDDWGWVGEGAVGIDSLDDTVLDDWGWVEVDSDEVWFKAVTEKSEGTEGAERELWRREMLNYGHEIWLWISVWLILDVILLVLWIMNYTITWLVFTLRKIFMRKMLKGKCRVPS